MVDTYTAKRLWLPEVRDRLTLICQQVKKLFLGPKRIFVGSIRAYSSQGWWLDFYCDKTEQKDRSRRSDSQTPIFMYRLVSRYSTNTPDTILRICSPVTFIRSDLVIPSEDLSEFNTVLDYVLLDRIENLDEQIRSDKTLN